MGGVEEFLTIRMSTLYSPTFHRRMMKNKINPRWNKRERDCFSTGAWGQARKPGPVSKRDMMRSECTRGGLGNHGSKKRRKWVMELRKERV